jgi:hypothetical protein
MQWNSMKFNEISALPAACRFFLPGACRRAWNSMKFNDSYTLWALFWCLKLLILLFLTTVTHFEPFWITCKSAFMLFWAAGKTAFRLLFDDSYTLFVVSKAVFWSLRAQTGAFFGAQILIYCKQSSYYACFRCVFLL